MSNIITGETMADVIGKVSNSLSIDVGLGLLEGFLIAMGAGSIITKLQNSYEVKGAKTLKFRFSQATRDYINVMEIGNKLIKHHIMEEHALYVEGYHYYLVTAVARSPSISIMAEDNNSILMNIDLEAMKIIDVSAGASVTKSNEGEVTFAGKKSLAFGVELYELKYDVKSKTLKLLLSDTAIRVRGKRSVAPKPVFIGGSEGNVFITVD